MWSDTPDLPPESGEYSKHQYIRHIDEELYKELFKVDQKDDCRELRHYPNKNLNIRIKFTKLLNKAG